MSPHRFSDHAPVPQRRSSLPQRRHPSGTYVVLSLLLAFCVTAALQAQDRGASASVDPPSPLQRAFEDSVRTRILSMLPKPETYTARAFTHSIITQGEVIDREIELLDAAIRKSSQQLARDSAALLKLERQLEGIDSEKQRQAWKRASSRLDEARRALDTRLAEVARSQAMRSSFQLQRRSGSASEIAGYRIRHRFTAKHTDGTPIDSEFEFTYAPDGRLAGAIDVTKRGHR